MKMTGEILNFCNNYRMGERFMVWLLVFVVMAGLCLQGVSVYADEPVVAEINEDIAADDENTDEMEDLSAGELLYKYGFVSGSSGSVMKLDAERSMTRVELAVVAFRLGGGTAEDLEAASVPDFLDSAVIPAWAKRYVAFSQNRGLMLGDNHFVFDSAAKVTGRQLAVFLLRMLGREAQWGTAVEDMAQLGIVMNDGEIVRGEAFEYIWQAVSMPLMADGSVLGVVLGRLTGK